MDEIALIRLNRIFQIANVKFFLEDHNSTIYPRLSSFRKPWQWGKSTTHKAFNHCFPIIVLHRCRYASTWKLPRGSTKFITVTSLWSRWCIKSTEYRLLNQQIVQMCRSKKILQFRVTGLCEGNSPVAGEFPAQGTSNAENVSIWWRHHVVACAPCGTWYVKQFLTLKRLLFWTCIEDWNGPFRPGNILMQFSQWKI